MRRYITLCCLVVSLMLQASDVGAATYPFSAQGTIDSIVEDVLSFNGNLSIGSPFGFSFDVNTTTADSDPDPGIGRYHFTNFFASAGVGPYVLSSSFPAQGFDILINTGVDSSVLVRVGNATSFAFVPPGAANEISIHLSSPTVPLTSDALVPELFDLDLWDDAIFSFYSAGAGGSATATGHIDTLTQIVPEPASGVLLLGGLVALVRRRRR